MPVERGVSVGGRARAIGAATAGITLALPLGKRRVWRQHAASEES